MEQLITILNIIGKRDSDMHQDTNRDVDHEQDMADAINDVLNEEWERGKQVGISQEREFWVERI